MRKLTINTKTGEQTRIDLSAVELEQVKKDKIAFADNKTGSKNKRLQRVALLSKLHLTEQEAKLLVES